MASERMARPPIPLVWAVFSPGPERPWDTNESWNLTAVYESEAQARAARDEGDRVEPVPYFVDHTKGEAK